MKPAANEVPEKESEEELGSFWVTAAGCEENSLRGVVELGAVLASVAVGEDGARDEEVVTGAPLGGRATQVLP
jgi:hypothetical protein